MVTAIRVRGWGLGVLFAIALTSAAASAEPVAVRYAETITHGFLLLRGANFGTSKCAESLSSMNTGGPRALTQPFFSVSTQGSWWQQWIHGGALDSSGRETWRSR